MNKMNQVAAWSPAPPWYLPTWSNRLCKRISADREDSPHAVVVVGIDNDAVYLLDPDYSERTPVTVTVGDFALAWSHFDQAYAVLAKR